MLYELEGTRSQLGRSVSAEMRAQMAAQRISGKALALAVGMSQNYLAKRLRDEAPFTLDDIDAIVELLGLDVEAWEFIRDACERNRGVIEGRSVHRKTLPMPAPEAGDAYADQPARFEDASQ